MNSPQTFLNQWWLVGLWGMLTAIWVIILLYDLRNRNPQIAGLMKFVWIFTTAYSGPLGLWMYWTCGRRQISRDSIWRRAARSVAHCYAGCGMGEIVGVFVTVGLFSLGSQWVAGVTFVLAYLAGFTLTVGPLMQEGLDLRQAIFDALYSETASITVMEIVAIATDLVLTGSVTMSDALFWSSLVTSLTAGLAAAYPVNVMLIRLGVKDGMHDPREAASPANA